MGKPKIISYSVLGKLIIAIMTMVVLFYYSEIRKLPGSLERYVSPLIFLISSYAILRGIEIIYRFRQKLPISRTNNITVGLDNIFSVAIIVFFIFLSLSLAGISVVQFFTSISIFAAAIAIVSREYLNAMISGFIITFTNMINIGDYVLLNEQRGRIKDITLLKTYIENDQGELISINNDKAYLSDIINLTKSNKRRVNIKFEVNAQTIRDIDAFENEIIEQLNEFKQYIIEESISLKIEELKADKIDFILYYTLSELEPRIEKAIRRKTYRKLVSYIQSNVIALTPITNDSQKEKED